MKAFDSTNQQCKGSIIDGMKVLSTVELMDEISAKIDLVKVLERFRISPPPNSAPTTAFPLTFFDIFWMTSYPMQMVFFYKISLSVEQFAEEVLPQLKKSLSLALQRFLPLCGNLVIPPHPSDPCILYKDGDSVQLFFAESTGALSDFIKDGPKDAMEIHSLLTPTPTSYVLNDETLKQTPLLAAQVTLFPNAGLSIGIDFHHIAADGMSFMHFMKTWASIFKANCDMSNVSISLPVLDKSVVKDPDGIKDRDLEKWRAFGSPTWKEPVGLTKDIVRATFTLSRSEIERLKKWGLTKCNNDTETATSLHLSSYVVSCAYIWVCLIKSLGAVKPDDSSAFCHFLIAADCRNKYDLGIPATFFGNCVLAKFASIPRSKFKQEDCVAITAEAISRTVQSFKHGVLDWYKYPSDKAKVFTSGENILSVAGSPKLESYETDFGWGYPKKIEVVHIDRGSAISLSESAYKTGGIEIGICLSKHQMELFTSFFQDGLKQFLA